MKIDFYALVLLFFISGFVFSQSRVNYNGTDIFLNGSNVAWVNFASDIGPGSTDLTTFNKFFAELKAAGGNSFRLWLHTDGRVTPAFNSNGLVVGAGFGAVDDLKNILDLASQNEIGLMLCLWSHDMMRTSLPVDVLNRNQKLLTDTTAMRAYINNALIPMVQAVKGHPAILAWEVFNEPEGFTEIGNWGDRRHVKQSDVQRITNLIAGAIHRTDPAAKVTNGTWGLTAQVDVPTLAKLSPGALLNSMSSEEKTVMQNEVKMVYGRDLSAEEIIKEFYKPDAVNINYYRDDRLIAAGGDPLGTLDFYTVHYYAWAGTVLSPFHHSYASWKLDKPLVIAEFFMTETFGIRYQDLYRQLFSTGYAGALSWQWWNDTGSDAYDLNHSRTVAAVHDLYVNYPDDVVAFAKSGKIYFFTAAPSIIEKGDSSLVVWKTAPGSIVTLDGESVPACGSKYLKPAASGIHKLETQGDLPSSQSIIINLYPAGNIFSFAAVPGQILEGGKCLLRWKVSNGSKVTLNGTTVNAKDSIEVSPKVTTEYTLLAQGDVSQTKKVTVFVLPADQINWALYRTVTVSSSEGNGENDDPLFAVDGDESTRWCSAYSDQQWMTIDLKDTLQLSYILLDW